VGKAHTAIAAAAAAAAVIVFFFFLAMALQKNSCILRPLPARRTGYRTEPFRSVVRVQKLWLAIRSPVITHNRLPSPSMRF
jgi:hypothetical protein